ncbi:MAG TPA: hydrogenase maturation protease [Thermofilum sp.]|nr:hydrogenase maturation protease [Thermofilum sp.]
MEKIEEFLNALRKKSYVIIFTGSGIRGDDAVGLCIGEKVRESIASDRLVVCEGGVEFCLDVIRKLSPSIVVIVDAVDVGAEPGSIILIKGEKAGKEVLSSTHKLSLSLLSDILRKIYGVDEVWLIGVQVHSLEFTEKLSEPLEKACIGLAKLFVDRLLQ